MTKKRKRPSGDHHPIAQILTRLGSPEPATREGALSECGDLAAEVGAILAALLRGLTEEDAAGRLAAAKGILCAFPDAEATLSRLLADIVESHDPKVRLAVIRAIIILLPKVLADLAGFKPDELSTTGLQPNPFTEELMEHAGRWIAWTGDRTRILAVADSFADVVAQAEAAGESDPYVKKAPGLSPEAAPRPFDLLEDESPDILEDIRKVIPEPDVWLNAANDLLGGEKPRDLIATEREREVRYLLRGIEDGIST